MQRKCLLECCPRLRVASPLQVRRLRPAFQQGSPFGVVLRGELKRSGEAGLGAGHVHEEGSIAGEREVVACSGLQLRDVLPLAGGASQLERLDVVIGEHVAQVVDAVSGLAFDPGNCGPMPGGPAVARNLGVADVAHQKVPEAVFLLPLHRAVAGGPHQLLARQLVEGELDVARVALSHAGESSGPEHLADHGGVLEHALALGRERVQAGGDQGLHRVREEYLRERVAQEIAVAEQTHELLRIQRVAAGAVEQCVLGRARQHRPLQEQGDQRRRLSVGERSKVDRLCVAHSRRPGRMLLVELRPSGAEQEQRHPCGPVSQVLEKGEHRLVRPMQVVDHQHGGVLRSQPVEKAPPGGEGLLLRSGFAAGAHQRGEPCPEPRPVGFVLGDGLVELGHGRLRGVRLEDAALGLDDLAERPEGDPLAVRETPALAPADQSRALLDVRKQLGAEAGLAHPRLAHHGHQLAGTLRGGPLEGGDQLRPLEFPAHQRRRTRPDDVGAEAGPGGQRLPDLERLRLAFDLHRLETIKGEHALGLAVGRLRHCHPVDRGDALQA